MIVAGLLLFGAFSLALGRPTLHDDSWHVLDRRADVPNGFRYVAKADPNSMLDLRIALVQSNPTGLEAALYDVSTPGSKNYRKYLTKAEVDTLVAPKPESVQAVKTWLSRNNITAQTMSSSGDWLGIRIPVAQANALLDTQFNEYNHERTNLTALRTMSYSVPASVKGHLDFIYPVTSFVDPRATPATLEMLPRQARGRGRGRGRGRNRSSSIVASASTVSSVVSSSESPATSAVASQSSSKAVSSTTAPDATPATSSSRAASTTATSSRALSSTTSASSRRPVPTITPDESCKTKITPECIQAIYNVPNTPASNNKSNLFVASFVNESADPKDLQTFLEQFRPDIEGDASFAVQSVNGGSNNLVAATTEASLDIQYAVGIATNVKTTFVSVGSEGTDGIAGFLDVINTLIAQDEAPLVLTTSFGFNEKDVPEGLASNLCNAYAQLGARGTTILFGSGDGGVSGIQDTDCTTFQPTFPSTCPFLTSVGGTTSFGPEVAVDFSSGGFSNLFPRPSYQDDAVGRYLDQLGDTNKGLFNTTGRAFPDIAAQARAFQIVRGGKTISVSGTSAASPTVAGLVALLNDAILGAGGKPLGFLNPFLYTAGAAALNDITEGNNPGCGTDGFPAKKGWDPVTGLGTPDYVKLLDTIGKNA
ncbi:subtilisin-like protein [Fomes fomentarius]|nr:subtilisin-like protein [Fomes fomentarius]